MDAAASSRSASSHTSTSATVLIEPHGGDRRESPGPDYAIGPVGGSRISSQPQYVHFAPGPGV